MTRISPIDLELLERLVNLSMSGAALKRTSFSPIVRESNDFACVCSMSRSLLVQSTLSVPGFIGTAAFSLQHMLNVFRGETLSPGERSVYERSWIGTGHFRIRRWRRRSSTRDVLSHSS